MVPDDPDLVGAALGERDPAPTLVELAEAGYKMTRGISNLSNDLLRSTYHCDGLGINGSLKSVMREFGHVNRQRQ